MGLRTGRIHDKSMDVKNQGVCMKRACPEAIHVQEPGVLGSVLLHFTDIGSSDCVKS